MISSGMSLRTGVMDGARSAPLSRTGILSRVTSSPWCERQTAAAPARFVPGRAGTAYAVIAAMTNSNAEIRMVIIVLRALSFFILLFLRQNMFYFYKY